MRILIATPSRSIVGGVETYLQSAIPALLKRGHQVAMLYHNRRFSEAEVVDPEQDELPIWYCPDLSTSPSRWQAIADWRPDIVYSHCLDAPDIESVLLERYPCISFLHNYWGTCTTGTKCHDFPRTQSCNREFGLACLALHYPRRCGGLNPLSALTMFKVNQRRRSRLADYRRTLVASTHMYAEYRRHGVSPEKLRLLAYPLTDPALEIVPFAPKERSNSLLFVGRLTRLKGIDHLLRAIPKAARRLERNLSVTVIGDGPERTQIERYADWLGVKARFTGWINGKQKLEAMRSATLLVVPSVCLSLSAWLESKRAASVSPLLAMRSEAFPTG